MATPTCPSNIDTRLNELKATSLPLLYAAAEFLIDRLTGARDDHHTFNYDGSSVHLDAVLREMLHHAKTYGGVEGERYVAASIATCVVAGDPGSEDTLKMLHDLGKT
ncbi:hypothetical protein AX16_010337 [Volvariella volvacea WC 439]|nr:hypothetical protein AX16_010337 [Volvariella volvacea WC 439]